MSINANPEIEDRRATLKSLAADRDQTVFDLAHAYIAEARRANDIRLVTRLKLDLADYYYTLKSDHKKAIALCHEALPEVEKWNDAYLLGNVYKRIGSYSYFLSDYSTAGQYCNMARQVLEEMEPKTREAELELADVYYNLCVVYRTDNYNDFRIEMNDKALGIFLRLNEMIRVGRSYNLMGNMLLDKDKHEEALHQYLQALEIFENNDNTRDTNITYCYNNIGTCYRNVGQYDKSLEFLNKSLSIRQKVGSPNEVGVSYMLLGMTLYSKGALEQGEAYFLKAVDIFKQTGHIYELSHTALQLANLYKQTKDYQKATEFLDIHLSHQNALNSEDKRRAIAEALAQSKMEQKEAEAQLLRQKNAEIEEYAKKLQTSNDELNQFAHIVSHDLKEPLRMISSYTDLLNRRLQIQENPEAQQFMTFITEGAERMNNLINELLEFSKVGASYKIQPTDLNVVLKIAMLNLSGLIADRKGQIEIHPLPIITSDKTMMLQLFQNLLGNGIKYSAAPTPTAGVSCIQRNKEIELHFYDNGKGVPTEYREKVFEIFRRLPESSDIQGTGIGLSICHKIVSQLRGRIWVEPNTPQGSVFKVVLPV